MKFDRKKLLTMLSAHKNLIFVIMCLSVHLFNCITFGILKLYPLMIINLVSSITYLCVLALYDKESDKEIVFIYFEIIIFAFISDLLIGGLYEYFLFVIGMVSVISFLLSDKFTHKHLLQGIGSIFVIVMFIAKLKNAVLFPEEAIAALQYRIFFNSLTIFITIVTLVFVSGLYGIELQLTKEQLRYAGNHDNLTDLYNRRFFQQALQRSVTENSSQFSIAMFDIDNFKKVNDTYGHDIGDKTLQELSRCLHENLKEGQLPIRWGGEEFILYMPVTDKATAVSYTEEVVKAIRNISIPLKDGSNLHITVTVGVESGSDLSEYEKVIKTADERLYKGKQNGKNCIVFE